MCILNSTKVKLFFLNCVIRFVDVQLLPVGPGGGAGDGGHQAPAGDQSHKQSKKVGRDTTHFFVTITSFYLKFFFIRGNASHHNLFFCGVGETFVI